MSKHEFEGFTVELIPECESVPMNITIDNAAGFTIELPKTGAFHFVPLTNSAVNVVMFKMDNETTNPPEISFHLSNDGLEKLKEISVLPVIG
ncbi:hypothetical protein [Vibrio scophthalmi]|uniref:Uncharacterized protein n=1 Tax=Vibrio scophthalmi TaxID=45658 RepID=A0A1E3WL12_9VIBR|nr:hypothetical protein [Vibrio scophthalmi]ODS09636.1 hypothetical protein VSF3289_03300 [Vibrio scophthalmi]